jgi:hypothetical protein
MGGVLDASCLLSVSFVSGDWHIWELRWNPDELVFAMDGTVTGQVGSEHASRVCLTQLLVCKVNTTDHLQLLTQPHFVIFGLAVMGGGE